MKKAGWDTCLVFSLTTPGQVAVLNLLSEYIIRWPNSSLKNWLLQTLLTIILLLVFPEQLNIIYWISFTMKTVSQRLQLLHFFPPNKSLQKHHCSPPFLFAVQSTSAGTTALTVTIGHACGTDLIPGLCSLRKLSFFQQHHPLDMQDIKILSFRFSDEACQPRPASLKNIPSLFSLSFLEEYLKQQQQRRRKGKITSITTCRDKQR